MNITFVKLFSTQLNLTKIFQRETLVTEQVLSHCCELGSALFNWWFIILRIISNTSHARGPPYTWHSMNMEQKGTFCSQELLVLVEDWRGRRRQTERRRMGLKKPARTCCQTS